MSDAYVNYPCPYCHTNKLETKATLPYVRGFLVVFQYGYKKIIGCRSCVRKQLLKETAKSALIGWFSPKALIANPFLIVYGLGRTAFVGTDIRGVKQELKNAGIAEPGEDLRLVDIGYSLAASMIAADKKIEQAEIDAAIRIGSQIFSDFDGSRFQEIVLNHRSLPEAAEMSAMLGDILDEQGKVAVCGYLLAIASADGHFADEEKKLMDVILANIRLDPAKVYVSQAA